MYTRTRETVRRRRPPYVRWGEGDGMTVTSTSETLVSRTVGVGVVTTRGRCCDGNLTLIIPTATLVGTDETRRCLSRVSEHGWSQSGGSYRVGGRLWWWSPWCLCQWLFPTGGGQCDRGGDDAYVMSPSLEPWVIVGRRQLLTLGVVRWRR